MNDIIKRIEEADHIVVISKLNPDADSIGSASAVYTYLLRLHKKVSFFCASKNISKKYSCIPWYEKIKDSFPSSADLAISFDCADMNVIGTEIECDLINIDKHFGNTNYGRFNLVDISSISTTKIVFDFFKNNNISLNSKMATALYAGLLDDSDGFMSDEVDGTIFAVVGELIDSGAEYKLCNRFIKKYHTLAALRLKSIMLADMKLLIDAKVALFLVTQSDMKKSGAADEDCESALQESLYMPSVEVSVLLMENADFSIKVFLLSKGNIDVLKIASKFSGGGHKTRADFLVKDKIDLQEMSKKILKIINEEI